MDLAIIPQPRRVTPLEGVFSCAGEPRVITKQEGVGQSALNLNGENEAYRLRITPSALEVTAPSGAGLHHGRETARQLVLSHTRGGRTEIPCAEIEDAPRFPWRGCMIDTARHYYEPRSLKKIIDALSLHHINVFHWHLTDDQGWRFDVPGYPRLVEVGSSRRDLRRRGETYGGWYSDGVIREIVEYAAARHILVVPEVDMPGHAVAALAAYPALGCTGGPYEVEDRYGVFSDVYCAGGGSFFPFAEAVFDAVCRLFPSRWVHIGGDEAPRECWSACPRCRELIKKEGLRDVEALQPWITGKLAALLAARGKNVIGWDEILDGGAALPAGVAVMSWRGREGGVKAAAAGHNVIMSPHNDGCYLDYRPCDDITEPGQLSVTTLEQSYRSDPLAGIEGTAAEKVLGGQGNLWSELIYADRLAEYMLFPRISALAEALWTPAALKDFAGFERRLATHRKRLDALGLVQFRAFEPPPATA